MHTALCEQDGKPLGLVRWRAPTTGRILGARGDRSPVCWRPWRGQGSEAAQTTCREPGPFAYHRSLLTTNFGNRLCSRCSFRHSVCLICLPPNPLQTRGFLPCAGNQRAHYLGLGGNGVGVGSLLITGKKLAQLMSARPLGLEGSPGLDTGQRAGGNAPRSGLGSSAPGCFWALG